MNILFQDHAFNEEIRRKIQAAIGEYDELLTLVKKRKQRWLDQVSKYFGLAKTILQCKEKEEEAGIEWKGVDFASSTRAAENRTRWKGIVAYSSLVP